MPIQLPLSKLILPLVGAADFDLFVELTNTQFTKIPFSDDKYFLHFLDVSASAGVGFYFQLVYGGEKVGRERGWHFKVSFDGEISSRAVILSQYFI